MLKFVINNQILLESFCFTDSTSMLYCFALPPPPQKTHPLFSLVSYNKDKITVSIFNLELFLAIIKTGTDGANETMSKGVQLESQLKSGGASVWPLCDGRAVSWEGTGRGNGGF